MKQSQIKIQELRFGLDKMEQALPLLKSAGWDTSDIENEIRDGLAFITENIIAGELGNTF